MEGTPRSFWGKLEMLDGTPVAWHPLEDHCADVAACCELLLERTVLSRRLATLLGWRHLSPVHRARLTALAALHDIGKFNLGFQAKATTETAKHRGHVREVLALFTAESDESERLGEALRIDELDGWCEGEGIYRLLVASIAHHGRPQRLGGSAETWLWAQDSHLDPMAGIRQLRTDLERWLPLAFGGTAAPLPDVPAFHHAFSGLVTLADWMGSSRSAFPFTTNASEDRWPVARRNASRMVETSGIDPDPARLRLPAGRSPFSLVSGFEPRPAQEAVLAQRSSESGSVTVLEAETGSGKTEAALARFLTLFAAGLVDGIYFALPTRTAASQIHRRVVEAVERAFPKAARPPVTLAVPGYLAVDDREGARLPGFEVLWNDEDRERWRFRGWASETPKRYLAGAIVIGTIDQVLLSALATSHAHLRATSLQRHLLVVDEVHASDAYMNRLLEVVLERHTATGGHALLMSATLGSSARTRLLREDPVELVMSVGTPYPAVHHKNRGGRSECHAVRRDGREKFVQMEASGTIGAPETISRRALAAASAGARVLVIRNTVADCLDTQAALERIAAQRGEADWLFSCCGVVAPHHARFAAADRKLLDEAIEQHFGRRNAGGRGVVAVATQTVQQSLDIDADFILTDLCPADVLLQRLGRLHRHADRDRPAGFDRPQAVVLTPATRDLSALLMANGRARGRWGLGNVYPDLRIIEATWRAIENTAIWRIPSCNRQVIEQTTHPAALEAIASELPAVWRAHAIVLAGQLLAQRGQASLNLADWSVPFGDPGSLFPSGELDRRIASRLGESDRRAQLPTGIVGPFGALVSELRIPAHLCRDVEPDDEVRAAEYLEGELRFRFGTAHFQYDRSGLRRRKAGPVEPEEEIDA